jgi:hypothetical protein
VGDASACVCEWSTQLVAIAWVANYASPTMQAHTCWVSHFCSTADPGADQDAEVDFLLNVGHIQLHRRARCVCLCGDTRVASA